MKPCNVLLHSLLVFSVLATCQPSPAQTVDASASANAAYQQKDWPTALKLYGDLAQSSPQNPRYSYRLGVAQRATGENEKALHSFQQAQANGLPLLLVGFRNGLRIRFAGPKR